MSKKTTRIAFLSLKVWFCFLKMMIDSMHCAISCLDTAKQTEKDMNSRQQIIKIEMMKAENTCDWTETRPTFMPTLDNISYMMIKQMCY